MKSARADRTLARPIRATLISPSSGRRLADELLLEGTFYVVERTNPGDPGDGKVRILARQAGGTALYRYEVEPPDSAEILDHEPT